MVNMSGEVLGLMLTGIIVALALVVVTQMQSLSIVSDNPISFASNATNNILSGLNVYAQFFAVLAIIGVVVIIIQSLRFKQS